MQLTKTNEGARILAHEIARVAGFLWERGWAEAGAGNISVNVSEYYSGIQMDFRTFPLLPLHRPYPALAGQFIMITRKGARMRDFPDEPGNNFCLVKINKSGDMFQLLFEDLQNPHDASSELLTHLGIHELLLLNNSTEKAILHTHAHELISLTHIPEYKSEEALNRLLWSMHTETLFFIPEGIGYVPFCVPGTSEMADASIESLRSHKVVLWEKHGVLSIGDDVGQAFDRIDILAKAAKIFLTCRNAGFMPEGLSSRQIEEIRNTILYK